MNPGHVLWILFGPGTWGAGGNMVAWAICGVLGFGWLYAKEKANHLARMRQAELHHAEKLAQAEKHHQKLLRVAADTYRHVTGEDHPAQAGE